MLYIVLPLIAIVLALFKESWNQWTNSKGMLWSAKFYWNFLTQSLVLVYLPVLLSALINLRFSFSFQSFSHGLNTVSAIVAFVFTAAIPFIFLVYYAKNVRKLE